MGTTPASSCLRSTTPPSDDGREYAAFPEGCEYAAFPEGEEDQQQHVVYNPQPAAARGLQPLAAPVRGLHPQPAAIRGLQPLLAGRGGDTGGGGEREEGLRKTRSIPWLELLLPSQLHSQPPAAWPRGSQYILYLLVKYTTSH